MRYKSGLKAFSYFLTIVFVASSTLINSNASIAAVSSDFMPGNIISDEQFFDGNALSSSQVQAFLNSKVPDCTINNGNPSRASGAQIGNTTIAQTCLKDYAQTTTNMSGLNNANQILCNNYVGANSESAATIIAKVGQACGISQKVLLVLLEKEQSLVTDSWPTNSQINSATGFACYDNNQPCVSTFGSFFGQVWAAAKQFKNYGISPTFNWFPVGKYSNVRYQAANTEASRGISCGTASVLIENKATAALYYYTPYTPNAAALSNLYGSGDLCSAYGNRNFWRLYVDWFGPSTGQSWPSNSGLIAKDGNGQLWLYPYSPSKGWYQSKIIGTGWQNMSSVNLFGDVTGDGNRDVIALDTEGNLWIYPTDGKDGWFPRVLLSSNISQGTKILSTGDMDGALGEDLILISPTGDLSLYSGNGHGEFKAPVLVGTGWGIFSNVIGAGDLDSDGLGDLLAITTKGTLILYAPDGAGRWKAPREFGSGWNGINTATGVCDFDGDGIVDIVGRTTSGTLYLYKGNGYGGFSSAKQIGSGWNGMSFILGAPYKPRGAFVYSSGSGDIDEDGARDILAQASNGNIILYRGNRVGGWRGADLISNLSNIPLQSTSIGDFDGDGTTDFAYIDSTSQNLMKFSILPNKSASIPISIGTGWGNFNRVFQAGDKNKDGYQDVFATETNGNLWLYPGNGLGGWLSPSLIGTGWSPELSVLYSGDFDGNGFSDLLSRDSQGYLWLYPGNEDLSWGDRKLVGIGWGGFSLLASVGDISGDNYPDLVARNSDGNLWLYPGNGYGSWKAPRQIGTSWTSIRWIQ